MAALSDFMENLLIDGMFRGGCLTTAGAAGSTAVTKGIRAASTVYSLGDIVVPASADTAAGGKLLMVTTAGTSAGTLGTLALGNPGTTVTSGGVTFTVIATMPSLPTLYVALFTANPTDAAGGTEVTGGSYARVAVASTLANWAGTQAAGSTSASSGTGGTTSNNAAVTFPAPTANWGTITGQALFTAATGGSMVSWGALSSNKVVNSGDAAPSFDIGSLTFQIDN